MPVKNDSDVEVTDEIEDNGKPVEQDDETVDEPSEIPDQDIDGTITDEDETVENDSEGVDEDSDDDEMGDEEQNDTDITPLKKILYYNFNNGDTTDQSGNGNNGIKSNVTFAQDRFGAANKSIRFNGENTKVSVEKSKFPIDMKSTTFSAWVKVDDVVCQSSNICNGYILINGNDYHADSFGIGIHKPLQTDDISKASVFAMAYKTGSVKSAQTEEGLFTDKAWHHIVGVMEGMTAKIYVDGVEKAAKEVVTVPLENSDLPVWIGAQMRQGYYYFFKGDMDDVSVFNRAMNSDEVKALYDAEKDFR